MDLCLLMVSIYLAFNTDFEKNRYKENAKNKRIF